MSKAWRQTMSFYKELSNLLAKDRAFKTPHTYSTTVGQELSTKTPLKEVHRGPRTMSQLMAMAYKESVLLMLVPAPS